MQAGLQPDRRQGMQQAGRAFILLSVVYMRMHACMHVWWSICQWAQALMAHLPSLWATLEDV